jgi:hypothetical protein
MTIKVTVNLPTEAVQVLKDLSKVRGCSVTETLIRCIGTEKYISDKVSAGARVLVKERNGNYKQLVFKY